jgi:hypothetical protein
MGTLFKIIGLSFLVARSVLAANLPVEQVDFSPERATVTFENFLITHNKTSYRTVVEYQGLDVTFKNKSFNFIERSLGYPHSQEHFTIIFAAHVYSGDQFELSCDFNHFYHESEFEIAHCRCVRPETQEDAQAAFERFFDTDICATFKFPPYNAVTIPEIRKYLPPVEHPEPAAVIKEIL